MESSDDYAFDDIILDDRTLAILDQSEQKYLKETSAASNPPVSSEPVNKRLKTATGWIPGTGSSRNGNDELPEISLHGDGTYGISSRTKDIKSIAPESQLQARQISHSGLPGSSSNHKPQANYQSAQASGSHLVKPPAYPVNNRQRQQYQILNNHSRDKKSREIKGANAQSPPALVQLSELQRKLDELREENSRIKSALQEAVDNKLAKDGEVSILRKNIEKNAQNYANQINLLKVEKDKADVKQVQMQNEMKDEIERLRTQFVFRQQELESSTRKPPVSIRAKRLGRDYPSTPMAIPAAISGWSKGTQKPIEDTPARHTRLPLAFNRASPTRQVRKSPEKIRSGMLPGFENAFETSTPRKSPSKKSVRSKEEPIEPPIFRSESSNVRLPSQLSQGSSQFQFEPLARENDHQETTLVQRSIRRTTSPEQSQIGNDMHVLPVESDEDPLLEEIDIVEPINWKAELCRIILTHSSNPMGEMSFQQLLSLTHRSSSPSPYDCTVSCGRILEAISDSNRSDDYGDCIKIISESFLSILLTLHDLQPQPALAIIFSLLTKLVVSLPDFQNSLLSCQVPLQESESSSIIEVICSAILRHLQPTLQLPPDGLASEILSLLESLCFHIDVKVMERIEPLVRNKEVLMTLLHPSQSPCLLERSARLLVILSTYHGFHRTFLDIPDGIMDPTSNIQIKDALFDRLCLHLTELHSPLSSNFKTYVLTYFAQLSISHHQAHSLLGASSTLIPALVLYISQLTSSLWEDDGSLVRAVDTTSLIVEAVNQATFLLYNLIFGAEPNLNLRYTLQHASHRPFNSINHIFVVTFGRLSYCEPPSWIEAGKRQELEHLAEIAREVLEVVVDGPEGDSVWAAFQSEADEDNMLDEGEMEAQLMGTEIG